MLIKLIAYEEFWEMVFALASDLCLKRYQKCLRKVACLQEPACTECIPTQRLARTRTDSIGFPVAGIPEPLVWRVVFRLFSFLKIRSLLVGVGLHSVRWKSIGLLKVSGGFLVNKNRSPMYGTLEQNSRF